MDAAEVYRIADATWSFAKLDASLGLKPGMGQSPLEIWYRKVRSKAVNDLGLENLSRAIRQRLHLPITGAAALGVLREDLYAGHSYPGELIAAFEDHSAANFAVMAEDARQGLFDLADKLLSTGGPQSHPELDDELWREIAESVRRWRSRAGNPDTVPDAALTLSVVLQPTNQSQRFPLSEMGKITVGSAADVEVSIPQPASGLAKKHATLKACGGGEAEAMLTSPGQLNGHAISGPLRLRPGDVLTLGNVELTVATTPAG